VTTTTTAMTTSSQKKNAKKKGARSGSATTKQQQQQGDAAAAGQQRRQKSAAPSAQPPSSGNAYSCTLRRDEIACLKTALAVIVTKRRFIRMAAAKEALHSPTKKAKTTQTLQQQQQQSCGATTPSSTSATTATTLQQALWNVTGRPSMGTASHNNGNHGVVRFSLDPAGSPDASRTGMSLSSLHSPTQQHNKLPWSATHWTFHLQHVLRLAWQGAYNSSSSNNNNSNNNNHHRWQGLCLHAACQLEQAAAKSQQQQQEPSTGRTTSLTNSNSGSSHQQVVPEWIRTQWTSFAVPVKEEEAAPMTPNSTLAVRAVEAWFAVWKSIVQAKPVAMAELLVPILLDLLLLQPPPLASSIDSPTPTNMRLLRLEPAHLLLLLETALEAAPVAVLHQKTLDQLMASPSSSCVDNANHKDDSHPLPPLSLLPSANSRWYSTQDLASDYYYYHQRHATATTTRNNDSSSNDAGEFCLLSHGLANLSEALTGVVMMMQPMGTAGTTASLASSATGSASASHNSQP